MKPKSTSKKDELVDAMNELATKMLEGAGVAGVQNQIDVFTAVTKWIAVKPASIFPTKPMGARSMPTETRSRIRLLSERSTEPTRPENPTETPSETSTSENALHRSVFEGAGAPIARAAAPSLTRSGPDYLTQMVAILSAIATTPFTQTNSSTAFFCGTVV
jgi:hypothetical protein